MARQRISPKSCGGLADSLFMLAFLLAYALIVTAPPPGRFETLLSPFYSGLVAW